MTVPPSAALAGDPCEDVAPDGRVLAAAVVEHHHVTRGDIVYIVAHCSGRLARGPVQNRKRASGQAHAVIERLDAEALAGDAESVHGVAESAVVSRRDARPTAASDLVMFLV